VSLLGSAFLWWWCECTYRALAEAYEASALFEEGVPHQYQACARGCATQQRATPSARFCPFDSPRTGSNHRTRDQACVSVPMNRLCAA
jgi:hypothetical protein